MPVAAPCVLVTAYDDVRGTLTAEELAELTAAGEHETWFVRPVMALALMDAWETAPGSSERLSEDREVWVVVRDEEFGSLLAEDPTGGGNLGVMSPREVEVRAEAITLQATAHRESVRYRNAKWAAERANREAKVGV
jgi:hypothetical protein